MASLPPGPTLPPLVQALRWIYRPIPFMQSCARRYGPTFTIRPWWGPPITLLTEPAAIHSLFTADPAQVHAGKTAIVLRPLLGSSSLLLLDGPRHNRERKIMLPPFHGERMHAYGERMRAIADRVIARWPTDRPFSLRTQMQEIALEVILQTVLGIEDETARRALRNEIEPLLAIGEHPELLLMVNEQGEVRMAGLQALLGRFSPWERVVRHRRRIDELLREEFARRRTVAEGGLDILSLLLSARDDAGEPLTDESLCDQMVTLLVAGHETTATSLSFALYRLLRHPAALARARAESEGAGETPEKVPLPFIDAVGKETLRLHPVVPLVGRLLQAPARIGGRDYPAGAVLAPCIYLTHRRADLFPNPDRFRPERFLEGKTNPYAFFPFGGGARRCLGMAFALFEMRVVLARILRGAPLRLAPDYRMRIVRRGITFVPSQGVPVISEAATSRSRSSRPPASSPPTAVERSTWPAPDPSG